MRPLKPAGSTSQRSVKSEIPAKIPSGQTIMSPKATRVEVPRRKKPAGPAIKLPSMIVIGTHHCMVKVVLSPSCDSLTQPVKRTQHAAASDSQPADRRRGNTQD